MKYAMILLVLLALGCGKDEPSSTTVTKETLLDPVWVDEFQVKVGTQSFVSSHYIAFQVRETAFRIKGTGVAGDNTMIVDFGGHDTCYYNTYAADLNKFVLASCVNKSKVNDLINIEIGNAVTVTVVKGLNKKSTIAVYDMVQF